MPKRIDEQLKARAVRLELEQHQVGHGLHLLPHLGRLTGTTTGGCTVASATVRPVEYEAAHYATLNREPQPV